MADETDYHKIAKAMSERLLLAISSFRLTEEGRGGGLILNMDSGTSQHWKDYFADALEMMPGVKIDRELMHASPSSRRKMMKAKQHAGDEH